ncbi:hypothetical protein L873DRAFT_1209556 [Choiromyces venosus 120613-1]|uniref:Uncharacterized protein n=1 Tax=Choiromyces venosus 120613-1 TaxID=1336337 RepID=A0A3N4JSF0_9PEZI|nr:hypothetical protein L873DRAFT_1209556 [Choiromyces venosus 120613-1]
MILGVSLAIHCTRVIIRSGGQETVYIFLKMRHPSVFNCVLINSVLQRVRPHQFGAPPNPSSKTYISPAPIPPPSFPPPPTINVYCLVKLLTGRLHLSNCLPHLKLGQIKIHFLLWF